MLSEESMAEDLHAPAANWWTSLIQGTTAIPQSVAKLLDTVGQQIGLFLEPTHIRRRGQAEADVTIVKARVEAEIAIVQVQNKLAIQNIQDRADERVRTKESKRQKNMEAIAAQAVLALPEAVSEEPVDEDWITQFFNHCQDISNEEMQSLWARLLAGEVAKPGSFSLRTLDLIKVLDKDDADLFTRFCSMVWQIQNEFTAILPLLGDRWPPLLGAELGIMEFVRLASLGLIRFEPAGKFNLVFHGSPRLVLHYGGRHYLLTVEGDPRMIGEMESYITYVSTDPLESQGSAFVAPYLGYYNRMSRGFEKGVYVGSLANNAKITLGNVLLTEVGKELAAIAGSFPSEEYRSWVISTLKLDGWEVVEIAFD
jgi:hypothetical protein